VRLDLLQAAQLVQVPILGGEGGQPRPDQLLVLLLDALDRVIEQARASLLEDRVNVFDQHRINSFIPRQSNNKPL
jgi:hypothetical protein